MFDPYDHPAFALHSGADTIHPPAVVPVYPIHTLENPFCPLPWCACHTNQEAIAKLLGQISEGVLTLREAADFADGKLVN